MKIRLFPKFLIAMSVVSLVPIILLGNRLMSMGQLGVKTAVLELHLNTADKIAGDFESFIDNFDKKAGFVIRALSRMDWENKQILLSSFVDANSDVKQVSVISDKGSEVIQVLGAAMESKPQLSNYSVDKYFLKVVKDKRRAVRFYSKGLSRDIAFYYPFMNNFVVRILIDSKQIFQEVEATKVGDTGFSLITDSSGS
ncbi:MAG: cache domain-containing protein, partial [Elusimicrobiales bacterium]|nr:cache domain-containing protein [Elusimicrobiales bacterium]